MNVTVNALFSTEWEFLLIAIHIQDLIHTQRDKGTHSVPLACSISLVQDFNHPLMPEAKFIVMLRGLVSRYGFSSTIQKPHISPLTQRKKASNSILYYRHPWSSHHNTCNIVHSHTHSDIVPHVYTIL